MRFPHVPDGYGLLGSVFMDILAGLVFIILFIVVAGVLFVLVRFLLVATRAAELYIARNDGTQITSTPSDLPQEPVATPAPATRPTAPRTRTTKTSPPTSTT